MRKNYQKKKMQLVNAACDTNQINLMVLAASPQVKHIVQIPFMVKFLQIIDYSIECGIF